jgi:hypothetical protein
MQFPVQVQPAAMVPVYLPGSGNSNSSIPTPIYPPNAGLIAPQAPVVDYSNMARGATPHGAGVNPYASHGGSQNGGAAAPPPPPVGGGHHGGGGGKKHDDEEKGENVDPNFAPCRY